MGEQNSPIPYISHQASCSSERMRNKSCARKQTRTKPRLLPTTTQKGAHRSRRSMLATHNPREEVCRLPPPEHNPGLHPWPAGERQRLAGVWKAVFPGGGSSPGGVGAPPLNSASLGLLKLRWPVWSQELAEAPRGGGNRLALPSEPAGSSRAQLAWVVPRAPPQSDGSGARTGPSPKAGRVSATPAESSLRERRGRAGKPCKDSRASRVPSLSLCRCRAAPRAQDSWSIDSEALQPRPDFRVLVQTPGVSPGDPELAGEMRSAAPQPLSAGGSGWRGRGRASSPAILGGWVKKKMPPPSFTRRNVSSLYLPFRDPVRAATLQRRLVAPGENSGEQNLGRAGFNRCRLGERLANNIFRWRVWKMRRGLPTHALFL